MPFANCQRCGRLFHTFEPLFPESPEGFWPNSQRGKEILEHCPNCLTMINNQAFEITAPARLHFGLLSFGDMNRRQFGGAGVMLDQPALRVRFSPADAWSFSGFEPNRVRELSERIMMRLSSERRARSPQSIEVLEMPRRHVGFGSGTQLGLTIAAGILQSQALPVEGLEQLMLLAGRGLRSSVGSYGFLHGGLITEAGKFPGETLAPLIAQLTLPKAWCLLLVIPRTSQGLSGAPEKEAFAKLPPVPATTSDRLAAELSLELIPAARAADFPRFAASVARYGERAGHCFASIQQGAYVNESVAAIIRTLQNHGANGVGQSSWGPLVFAWAESSCAAEELAERVQEDSALSDCDLQVVAPAMAGATFSQGDKVCSIGKLDLMTG
jgi:beta-ribofuranosylaminobenzene 5'-phosphate synthase